MGGYREGVSDTQASVEELRLVPRPRSVVRREGYVSDPGARIFHAGMTEEEFPRLPTLPGCMRREFAATRSGGKPWLMIQMDRAGAGLDGRSIEAQRYTLEIAPLSDTRHSPVTLRAQHRAGVRYGLITLLQLLADAEESGRVPRVLIEGDEPAFEVRGVMLDVSRCRVPTMEHLSELVNLLALLKFDHLQLYTEHTFAYSGHEEVWAGASPMSGEEVRRLDAWARDAGIELVANQNCFGHLERWLKHARYAPLAETHGEWTFMTDWGPIPRSGPFSLCPTDPGSIELVRDMLGQLLPCFSSGLVNIGCDETFDVGQGRSRDVVEGMGPEGRGAICVRFIESVASIAREHGKRAMIWADTLLHHPHLAEEMSGDLIPLVWGYEPDAPFAEACAKLTGKGREVWVCPGTSTWRSVTGRTRERQGNLRAAAVQGKEAGATGFLVTEWGDCGHRQQWPLTVHALADAAGCAWNPGAAAEHFDAASAARRCIGPGAGDLGAWLEALGDVDEPLRAIAGRLDAGTGERARLRNATLLFNEMEADLAKGTVLGPGADWAGVRARIGELERRMPAKLPGQIAAEIAHVLEVVHAGLDWAAIRDASAEAPSGALISLARRIRGIAEEHRRLWRLRSREGGLSESTEGYERMARQLEEGAAGKRAARSYHGG